MRPKTVTEAWAINKRNVGGEHEEMSTTLVRELDGHDLGDGDESCDVNGCDDYCTHALKDTGWVCERHAEIADKLLECAICGALNVGLCGDDHS